MRRKPAARVYRKKRIRRAASMQYIETLGHETKGQVKY
jgi:hypothetical protein